MQIEQIETDILLFRGESYESLATAFLDGDRVLLVDALASQDDAMLMRAHIEDTLGKRVAAIVLTHCFTDHMAGVGLFPEAVIIAQRLFMYTFMEKRDRSPQQIEQFVVPTMVVDRQLTLQWGRFALDIFHNPGKTVCSLGIDVAGADLLFVGDNIVGNIGYIGASAPELIDDAIARLQTRGRSRIVPGHVGVLNASALPNARHYLMQLREHVLRYRTEFPTQQATSAIGTITIDQCIADGVSLTTFERYWHTQNLGRIVERQLFLAHYKSPLSTRNGDTKQLRAIQQPYQE